MRLPYIILDKFKVDEEDWYKVDIIFEVHKWIMQYDPKHTSHYWPSEYSGTSFLNISEELLLLIKIRYPL